MAVGQNHKLQVLSTTRALVLPADASRTFVAFRNEDAAIIIRVGNNGVTAAATPATAGLGIKPGDTIPFASSPQGGDNVASAEWWAIAESGTPSISVLWNDQLA